MIEARRSANLILSDVANLGPNLWAIGDEQLNISLQPGQSTYPLPIETVDILDSYIRSYTPAAASTAVNIGNALTAVGPPNDPLIATPYGDPMLIQPPSGTLSCVAGNQVATLEWPSHGQQAGNPMFWGCPISIGGLAIYNFSIVQQVIDGNTLQFLLPAVALETQNNEGLTPLFFTILGSGTVSCILPGHGLLVGSLFPILISTAVGGLTLLGTYTVTSVQSLYQFSFAVTGTASSTAMAFENGGQLNITGQLPGVLPVDIFASPLSRDDFAMLPVKGEPGRPTQYWFNRTTVPSISTWPVTPNYTPGKPPYYGWVAYRMRAIQDANPVGGQVLDLPNRALQAFTAAQTAAMAEKFKPEAHAAKLALAAAAWDRFSTADREKVSTYIGGDMQSYFS